jgi:hypothetical protein
MGLLSIERRNAWRGLAGELLPLFGLLRFQMLSLTLSESFLASAGLAGSVGSTTCVHGDFVGKAGA